MEKLKNLIREGEHQTQDFKFRIDDQKKIARTLVAFANTDGGRLLIGVKDNGKIAGINPEEEFHMIQGAAELFCKPPVPIASRIWQEDMKLVLEIIVEPNAKRNHAALDDAGKWKIFIRREDHTLLANKIILKVWDLERLAIKKPQVFKEQELECLKTIERSQPVTLSKLYRMLEFPKSKTDDVVALLVHWKMVEMKMGIDSTVYVIKDPI